MNPSIATIFIILALVCFLLATFSMPRASWRDAGYACLTAAYLVS